MLYLPVPRTKRHMYCVHKEINMDILLPVGILPYTSGKMRMPTLRKYQLCNYVCVHMHGLLCSNMETGNEHKYHRTKRTDWKQIVPLSELCGHVKYPIQFFAHSKKLTYCEILIPDTWSEARGGRKLNVKEKAQQTWHHHDVNKRLFTFSSLTTTTIHKTNQAGSLQN